jgi:hypothetical protein
MSDKNNIDNLFRENLSEQQVGFNPQSWNKMEQMIVAQEKKRRVAWYIWGAGIAASVIILFGLFLNSNALNKSTAITGIVLPVSLSENGLSTPEVDIMKQVLNEQENINNKDKPKTENKSIENNDIDNQIVEKSTDVKRMEMNENVSLEQEIEKSLVNNVLIDDEYAVGTTIPADVEGLEGTGKEKRKEKKQARNEQKLALMKYRVAELKVAEDNNATLRSITSDKMNWIRKVNINFIAGANVSQGFLNQNLSRNAPSLDPVIGLGASVVVNSLVSLDVNVLYHTRGGLSQEKLPETFVKKGTSEITQSLHYIDVPFYINYRFQNRHAIRFGLQYSRLIGTLSSVSSESVTTTWKQQDYYASYDVAGMVGYKYLVNERFNVGIRGNFGLFDVTLGQPAGANTFDMNRQIRFLLEYKLLKY